MHLTNVACSTRNHSGMRVTLNDGRQICGRFMAYDRHMNLVLGDAEEFRKLPPKKGKSDEDVRRAALGGACLCTQRVLHALPLLLPAPVAAPCSCCSSLLLLLLPAPVDTDASHPARCPTQMHLV
jgi:small nuclear ribonucleoprotein (snRNP)-like protein